jgi:NIPSNAP protein
MSLKRILCLAALTAASTLIAPASAQQATRVFEIRTYTCNEGKLPDLLARFRNHTVQIFEKHGMTSIGYWVPQDAPLSQNTLIYILAHPSREAAKKNWAAFQSDPEWQKVQKESEANGKIVNNVVSVFMEPTDFSAIK